MATQREKVSVEMLVQPKLDPKAVSSAMREAKDLQRKLSSMKVDWKSVSKHSAATLRSVNDVSTAASAFAKDLSMAAKMSFKELNELGKQIGAAAKKAEGLKQKYASAKSPADKKQAASELNAVSKEMLELTQQVNHYRKSNKVFGDELQKVSKAQVAYRKSLQTSAKYTGKNFSRDMGHALRRASGGGLRGAIRGVAGAGDAGAKYSKGVGARAALAGGGQAGAMGSALSMLSKSVPILAGLAAGLTGLWQLIKAASEHQTKLNKALMEGVGSSGDFTTSTDQYARAVDDVRHAAMDSSKEFLRFGGNSEQALKIVNRYAVESTGSLMKTRTALANLGDGDVQQGLVMMAKNAMAFGRALGMEAEDVGSMMGQLQSEAGYAESEIQGVMSNVVKAAATANMPMTKFMSIFRQVLPDVELYQNRLEELTGTIKLLSKAMSPKDVKRFMEAFGKGFSQTDFRQRLKTTLITGVGFVSKTLDTDFSAKAKSMAENFAKYGIKPEEFEKAYKGGTGAMAELVSKTQGRAAAQGEQLSGTEISNAMKLARFEGARQKGGALNMATAMKGGGMLSTFKILKEQSQAFTKGFDGLAEHVIQQTGISEDQYEALRSTSETMQVMRSQIDMYGKTNSKSLNSSLRSLIAQQRGIDEGQVTSEMMKKATEDQLFLAAEKSNDDKKAVMTAEDLAVQQVTATTSIGDKIENIIAYLLEKIYYVLEPILKVLDKVWEWLVGSGDQKAALSRVDRFNAGIQGSTYGTADKGKIAQLSGVIGKGIQSGATGGDLAAKASGAYDPMVLQENAKAIAKSFGKQAESRGMKAADAANLQTAFYDALKAGKIDEAFRKIAEMPGDVETNLMQFGQNILPNSMSEAERARLSSGQGPMRRPGAAEEASFKTKKEYEDFVAAKREAADIESDMTPMIAGKGGAVAVPVAGKGGAGTATPASRGVSEKQFKETQEEQAKQFSDSLEDQSKEQVQATEDVYDGIHDLLTLLKKGIRYESTFLTGQWANVLKTSTLEAYRTALLEYAVIQARMQDSDGFRKLLSVYGQDVAGGNSGVAVRSLMEMGTGSSDPNLLLEKFNDKRDHYSGSKLVGGPVHDTGMYRLHRGEYVVPSQQVSSAGSGKGGGGNVYATVNISGSGLSQQQLEGAVFSALDSIARRS